MLHPHRLDDPEFRRRFREEARLGSLLDHPRLARLLDPGAGSGPGWIALEYVPGPTLADHCARAGALPLAEAVASRWPSPRRWPTPMRSGVVHRDLKPANVILGERGPR